MTIARVLAARPASEIFTCHCDDSCRDALAVLAGKRIGALPVLDDAGQVAGILSERDIIYQLQRMGPAMLDCKVAEVMTAPAITVRRDTGVGDALALMTRRRIRHLPVIEGQQMVAFVSIGDLVKHRIDVAEAEAATMRSYIQSA